MERPHEIGLVVLCRVRSRVCALPLEHVTETMRPLPIDSIGGAPSFVLGLSVIRGAPTPVVDLARILGLEGEGSPTRFVTLKTANGAVAIAVDAVIAIRPLAREALAGLPPLLREASHDAVAAIGALDGELLLLLSGARLVPDALRELIQGGGAER